MDFFFLKSDIFPTRNFLFVFFFLCFALCHFFSEKKPSSVPAVPLKGRVVQHGAAVSNLRGVLMPGLVNLKMSMKLWHQQKKGGNFWKILLQPNGRVKIGAPFFFFENYI